MIKNLFITLFVISTIHNTVYPSVIKVIQLAQDSKAGKAKAFHPLDSSSNELYYVYSNGRERASCIIKIVRNNIIAFELSNGEVRTGDILVNAKWKKLLDAVYGNSDIEQSEKTINAYILKEKENISKNKYTREDSSLFFAYLALADLYYYSYSDFAQAFSAYLMGLKLLPKLNFLSAEMILRAGDCMYNSRNMSEALEWYRKGLKKLRENPRIYKTAIDDTQHKISRIQKEGAVKAPVKKSSPARMKIVQAARSLLGKRWSGRALYKGKRFRYDCSGVVSRIYWEQTIDLFRDANKYRRMNGVKIIYYTLKNKNMIFKNENPAPGDIIFFDNTYDANRNRRIDDTLVHVGLVESIDADGTISLIHHCSTGIKRYKMNLTKPHIFKDKKTGKIYNSYIRRRRSGDPDGTPYLTGETFNSFGTAVND
ncbi:NlpC/P60 family protein [Spirochaetota bacterium]